MSYPLPGETVTKTLRNVEFGMGRPRDEPAPPEIAELFREMQEAFTELGSTYQQWRADRCPAAWQVFRDALGHYENTNAELMRALRRRPGRCFTCDGHRFWLHVESHGCRRNVIKIEEM